MRVLTWNMGCAYGGTYHAGHPEAWRRLESLEPDVALLQEVLAVPDWVDPAHIIAEPRNTGGRFRTLVYVRGGSCNRVAPHPVLGPLLGGQVVIAEVAGFSEMPILMASVHTRTGPPRDPERSMFDALTPEEKSQLRLPKDSGSWNASLILAEVERVARDRQFVAGGDFNLAWRFDETQGGSTRYWASEQFKAMRNEGWRRPHLKFHAGEERTFFRHPHELLQLDHYFTDEGTYRAATRCDVMYFEDLNQLSDHAPLLLEIDSHRARHVTSEPGV